MSLALIRANPIVELNPEQELAVRHGIGDSRGPGPLLVVAGAGSGKTAMLAHRVAALILAGADPKRIMLATFSRRAAAELGRPFARGAYGGYWTQGLWTAYGPDLRTQFGAMHWAGAETSPEWNGKMEGAVQSGEHAAAEVLKEM